MNAKQVGTSVRRLRVEGERLVGRVQRDARELIARGRTDALKEVRKIRADVQGRAERAIRTLEKRVMKELHAATVERVAALEKRVRELEKRFQSRAA